MQTAKFFSLVLPAQGLRCVATKERNGFAHWFFDDNDDAASHTLEMDARSIDAVYFACASYRTSKNRTGDNAAWVRSFWLDVDCGPEKPYKTQREGGYAVSAFTKHLALPKPSIVSSGRGLHVYWTMDDDMTPEEWKPLALALKQATHDCKLLVDQSRTADIATVLRAPGTHHRKAEPREVKVVYVGKPGSIGVP